MKILLVHPFDSSKPHTFDWSILVSTLSKEHDVRVVWWIVDELNPERISPELLPGIALSKDIQEFQPEIILFDGIPDPRNPKGRDRKIPLELEEELLRKGSTIVFIRAIPDINSMNENIGFSEYGFPIGLSDRGKPVRLCGADNNRLIKIPSWQVPIALQNPMFDEYSMLNEIVVQSPWILDDRPGNAKSYHWESLIYAPSHYDGKDPIWVYGNEIGGINKPFAISAWKTYPECIFLFTGDMFSDRRIKIGDNLILFKMLIEAISLIHEKSKVLNSQNIAPASVPNKLDERKIFISYARSDYGVAKEIYCFLQENGFNPWMDKFDLLPGQKWEFEIRKNIKASDYFIACLSEKSVAKTGHVQIELKQAISAHDRRPQGKIYLIPVRIDNCEIPEFLADHHVLDWSSLNAKQQLLRAINPEE